MNKILIIALALALGGCKKDFSDYKADIVKKLPKKKAIKRSIAEKEKYAFRTTANQRMSCDALKNGHAKVECVAKVKQCNAPQIQQSLVQGCEDREKATLAFDTVKQRNAIARGEKWSPMGQGGFFGF